jgi:peptidoglycan/LPS O-acetylase OafA/YrhL
MRIKRLDILRGVAVLLVVTGHAGLLPKVGCAGVDLFFVLSGFLISGLLYSEFKKRGSCLSPKVRACATIWSGGKGDLYSGMLRTWDCHGEPN